MTTAQRNVPALRFPEFHGEWVNKKIKSIAPLQRGFDLPLTQIKDGKYPVVYSNGILRTHNEFKVAGPSVVTGRSGTIGKVTFVDEKYWPHNTSLWVTDFCGNDPKYIYYFYIRIQLDKYNAGSTVPTLNRNDVHSIKASIPQLLLEQQKIAAFLSSVDTKIEQFNKKKALLEQYKKGMMQKLFGQEIRFKDEQGEEYPDWEEKRLSDVLNYVQPTAYLVKNSDYDDTYKTSVLTAGKTFLLGYTNEKTGIFIDQLPTIIFDDFTTAFQYVDFPFKAKSSAMKILVPKGKDVNMKYVYEAMKKIRFPLGEHKRYWISEYQKEKFLYPNKKEQQKIANLLSAIDRKIELVSEQLKQAQTFKKGLFQQMFI